MGLNEGWYLCCQCSTWRLNCFITIFSFCSTDCSLSMQSLFSNTLHKPSRKASDRYSQRCSFRRHEKPPWFHVSRRGFSGSGETVCVSKSGWKPKNKRSHRSEWREADESRTVRNTSFKQSKPSASLRATATAATKEGPPAASIAGSTKHNQPPSRICAVYAEKEKGPSQKIKRQRRCGRLWRWL